MFHNKQLQEITKKKLLIFEISCKKLLLKQGTFYYDSCVLNLTELEHAGHELTHAFVYEDFNQCLEDYEMLNRKFFLGGEVKRRINPELRTGQPNVQ